MTRGKAVAGGPRRHRAWASAGVKTLPGHCLRGPSRWSLSLVAVSRPGLQGGERVVLETIEGEGGDAASLGAATCCGSRWRVIRGIAGHLAARWQRLLCHNMDPN